MGAIGFGDAVAAAQGGVVQVIGKPGRVASGTVWADGIVLTIARAVRGDDVDVGLPDGRVVKATVVGKEPLADLAVLKVDAEGLVPLKRGDPNAVRVGDFVVPLGRPRGAIRAALGLVSGVAHDVRVAPGIALSPQIDVDGSLPPAFPGGPLVDGSGALLGVNTRGLVEGGTTIPLATLQPLVERLLAHGTRRRGWLGVATHDVVLSAAQSALAGQPRALAIVAVDPAGPAGTAGIAVGDLLLGLDGPLSRTEDVVDRLVEKGAGTGVTAKVLRGDQVREVPITLGSAPRRHC